MTQKTEHVFAPHKLYVGVTMSGKTTLARHFCREISAKNIATAAYDPLGTSTKGGEWGEKTIVFSDTEEFLDYAHSDACKNVHIFIDEAHHILSHTQKENLWMLTQGRHYGMYLHLLSQRPTKLHPDARTNCGVCFMFRLAADDARLIGLDYGHSNIHKINLDRGDFLVLNSGSAKFSGANVFKLVQPVK